MKNWSFPRAAFFVIRKLLIMYHHTVGINTNSVLTVCLYGTDIFEFLKKASLRTTFRRGTINHELSFGLFSFSQNPARRHHPHPSMTVDGSHTSRATSLKKLGWLARGLQSQDRDDAIALERIPCRTKRHSYP
jgi:hypothetical protein